jgi:hypothetical protein
MLADSEHFESLHLVRVAGVNRPYVVVSEKVFKVDDPEQVIIEGSLLVFYVGEWVDGDRVRRLSSDIQ